jgi:thiamine biosynthesis lipoprotein
MVITDNAMGTVISIDWRDETLERSALDEAMGWFHDVDSRFSPFLETSQVSRISAGLLHPADADDDMRAVIGLCDRIRDESEGVFNAWRTSGGHAVFDPSAVVRGWAVDRAAEILEHGGAKNFCIDAGGDVLTRGEPEPGAPWSVGLRHHGDPARITATVAVTNGCVATSGSRERGTEIVDARSGSAAPGALDSVSVYGPSLALADAYSTAAFAMGRAGVEWMMQKSPYEIYALTDARHALYSTGFAELLDTATLTWE